MNNNISELKDKRKYIGMGCVWWNNDLKQRPLKCHIVKIDQNISYNFSGTKSEEIFTIQLRNIYANNSMGYFKVKRNELWKNFRSVYDFIADVYTPKTLSNIMMYVQSPSDSEKKMIDLIRMNLTRFDTPKKNDISFDDLKKNALKELLDLQNAIKDMKETEIDMSRLERRTVYGFLKEMCRKYPEVKCSNQNIQKMMEFKYKKGSSVKNNMWDLNI